MSLYRTGRKLGRTIYRQVADKPCDCDVLLGMMDSPAMAQRIVDLLNETEHSFPSASAKAPLGQIWDRNLGGGA